METFVILVAVFAFVQATSPYESYLLQSQRSVAECVQEKNLDMKLIGGTLHRNILPEDDPQLIDFFECFYRKLQIINEDGVFDHQVVKVLSPQLIKQKFPNIADVEKVADAAYEHCKNSPQASALGLTAIKSRNCLMQYVAKQG